MNKYILIALNTIVEKQNKKYTLKNCEKCKIKFP